MGAVLAKFRKERTTTAILESLEEEIKKIEKYTVNTQEQKKRIVTNFLAISIGIYVIAFIIFYFVYFPPTWVDRIIYSIPLLLFPFVIILLRKLFTWYYQRKLNKNSNKLTELRTEKKKILEQVMDKETYKVAVNLLDRFGDKSSGLKVSHSVSTRSAGTTPSLSQSSRTLAISHRGGPMPGMRTINASTALSTTPQPVRSQMQLIPASLPRQLSFTPTLQPGQELRRRTPFPIVNQQEKGVLERIVDVLIGDGPKDRFAMICKECFAHNGMALKEEFDYTTFRCAFCNALNPSRKARPIAPRLPEQRALTHVVHSSDSSSSDESDKENNQLHQVPTIKLSEECKTPSATVTLSEFEFIDNESADTAPEQQADTLPEQKTNGTKEASEEENDGFEKLKQQFESLLLSTPNDTAGEQPLEAAKETIEEGGERCANTEKTSES